MKTKTFNNIWIEKVRKQNDPSNQKFDLLRYILKLFIPILSIITVTIVIIWALEISSSTFAPIGEKNENFNKDIMLGLKFYTNNYKNKPIEIRANSAQKYDKNEEIIVLDQPNGNTSLSKEAIINFSAKKGIYNTKLGQLKLLDDVHLWSSKGTNFFTDNISYDIDSGVFKGDRIILVNGPWGSLEGKGFIFKTKISTIKVKGRPLLNLKTEND